MVCTQKRGLHTFSHDTTLINLFSTTKFSTVKWLKRQQHRSNIQVDAVFDHYKINIAIPFLDHVISDLYAQFSRKFAKRNFRHIGWISINSLSIYCYFHVYYRYIHLYSTVCYCCIATGSCTLRGLHPAG